MRGWILAAGLLAAATATGAQAADLYDGPPPDRYGSAYDDPRYADIYKYPAPPPRYVAPPPPRVYERYGEAPPVPRERVYREEYYERDYNGPRRYSGYEPRVPYARGCVPREEIKDRLLRSGWHDFHDGDVRGEVATVRARRPSGRLFDLVIDRCSGEIVDARPLEPRRFGPYAYSGRDSYGPPPRRWDRAY
jgi:hypothetical protein